MSRQFIYHMRGLNKFYPGGKQVLNNVHLSFYPDAKIGVLGVNGSGKSTLLKIMAGLDKEWMGEAWVAEGATVGYLPQEPKLDETKTVRENVMLAVAKQQLGLSPQDSLGSRSKAIGIARNVGAQYVLYSSATGNVNSPALQMQLMLVQTGEIIWSGKGAVQQQ